jgi:hypothetical protein
MVSGWLNGLWFVFICQMWPHSALPSLYLEHTSLLTLHCRGAGMEPHHFPRWSRSHIKMYNFLNFLLHKSEPERHNFLVPEPELRQNDAAPQQCLFSPVPTEMASEG